MYLEETELPLYDSPREAWVGWASLTSVLLALAGVLMAFAAAHSWVHAYLGSQKQQHHWADYQALISKIESLHYSRDFFTLNQLLEPKSTKAQGLIEEKLQECEKEAADLNDSWQQFKAEAAELEARGNRNVWRVAGSVRAAFLFFLATVLAAFGGVGKKKLLWLTSLVLGGIGAASFVGGFFMWF
jgi:hypothetical protein